MPNIVGEGFSKEILGQVNQRQSQYGSINRSSETLNYLNNNTGWVKLVSSVDLTKEVADNRGVDLSGAELAKAYVLSGGVAPLKGGIARNGFITNSNAYGLGGTEFGLRAMPGLTKASIKTETRGALKTATVNIKANNRTQFDIIDLLYMRLGYSILLEWGNTSYFTNDGTFISDNLASLEDEFLNATIGYEEMNSKIAEKRNETFGNYDAVFAKVVNFSWSFQADGTYDISLTLRSMGDVIESLKSDILIEDTTSVTEDEDEEDTTPGEEDPSFLIIQYYKDAHSIGRMFYEYYTKLQREGVKKNLGNGGITYLKTKNIKGGGESVNFIRQDYNGQGSKDIIFYVRLGYFLEWLEKKIIPKVKGGSKLSNLVNIDTDVKSNIIHLQRYQLSADPRVCLFRSKWNLSDENSYEFLPEAEVFVTSKNNNRYGKLMNAYISMDWILQLVKNIPPTPDENGGVGLYDLIDEICKGWNTTTGNFNSLGPNVDSETNTLRLIDSTSLPDRDAWLKEFGIPTDAPFFDIYGYYGEGENSRAGFINKFDFTTTISNNLATQMTVGATSKGNMVGEDSTSLSRMNDGLTDRIKPEIVISPTEEELQEAQTQAQKEEEKKKKQEEEVEKKYKEAFGNFVAYIEKLGVEPTKRGFSRGKFDKDIVDTYSKTLSNLIKYDQQKLTEKAKKDNPERAIASPNSGFLPFDLSLSMLGLSGMKVYQKFFIDIDYLPSNYPKALEFLIKSVTHNISGNKWTTSIESMAIPKDPFGSGASKVLKQRKDTRKSKPSEKGEPQYFESDLPENEANNRAVLTRILDDGTQTLGYLDVYDDAGENILYTLTTVELPYKNNKNGESAVPTGEYLINSRTNGKYGKHFWLVGNKEGDFKRIPGANNTDRTWVLIHRAPKAPGWLQGCIGPSFTYNFSNKNSLGNPNGIGTSYLNPAKSESIKAQEKLVGTLFNVGGFKMTIQNLQSNLPTKFDDEIIQSLKNEPRLAPLFNIS